MKVERLGRRPTWVLRSAVVAAVVALSVVTVGWTAGVAMRATEQDAVAVDFRTGVWSPGRAVLDGRSPLREYSGREHDGGSVYPPIATLVTLPFSLPPYEVARVLWLLALAGAVLGALWLCGVRDYRCYLAACACPPVVAGFLYANVSLLLVLALALVWRYRDRSWLVAPLLGLVIAAKLFLWPLAVWIAVTRRSFAFALSVAFFGVLSLVGWSVVGFGAIRDYAAMLELHAARNDQDGVSAAALFAQLGIRANHVLALAAGILALLAAWSLRRDDRAAFAWAVTAASLASPMVWTHYHALLLVPIALVAPSWRVAWLLPFLAFPHVLDAATGAALAIAVACWATVAREREDARAPRETPATRRSRSSRRSVDAPRPAGEPALQRLTS
jgi:hypothetical protein